MANPKAKTIQLLLYNGSLNGVINIADSAWNPGEMYASPRDSVNELIQLNKFGVYMLLSSDRVYVGQAQDLKRRINQHLSGKSWWERVVLLTTQDDSFTRTDIDYLESVLIGMAEKVQSLESDNRNKGNNPRVDKFRKVILDQYLDEALFLMELIGISVFGDKKKKLRTTAKKPLITISTSVKESNVPITELPSTATADSTERLKTPLPDDSLAPGEFVKTSINNLLSAGYVLSEEQIDFAKSVEKSKKYTHRNLPMIWVLKEDENINDLSSNIKTRYWKDIFVSGKNRFLFFSQWYADEKNGPTKKDFISWYSDL